jgi:hypothetical protein
MGKGQILSGGANGLYTVRLDYGEAERAAELVRIAAQLIDLNNKSLAVGSQITTVDGEIATAQSAVSTAISNYEAAIIANQPLAPFEKAIVDAQNALSVAVSKKAPLANEKARLDGQIKNTQGRQSLLENLPTQQTKSVWCVDLTEDGSGQVGTIEVPGEPKRTLLVPGAVAPTAADGKVVARELLRYDQLFFNAALLPGWQKFKPTYRTGTITNINGDVCTVNLDLAESSAKNLPINQSTFLNNVPIQYLDCNGAAFEDGDKVVVKFEGQNWATPKVIGFVDNPKPCSIYLIFKLKAVFLETNSLSFETGLIVKCDTVQFVNNTGVDEFTPNDEDSFLTEAYISRDTQVLVANKRIVDESITIEEINNLNLQSETLAGQKIAAFDILTPTQNTTPSISATLANLLITESAEPDPCDRTVTFSLGSTYQFDASKTYNLYPNGFIPLLDFTKTDEDIVFSFNGNVSSVLANQFVNYGDTGFTTYLYGVKLDNFDEPFQLSFNQSPYQATWKTEVIDEFGNFVGVTSSTETITNSMPLTSFPNYQDLTPKKIYKVFKDDSDTTGGAFGTGQLNYSENTSLLKDFVYIAVEYGK